MAKVIDLIEKNIVLVKTFVKIGVVPLKTMNDYEIYLFYKSITHETAPMRKYKIVADKFKIHIDTVRRAIENMNKNVAN